MKDLNESEKEWSKNFSHYYDYGNTKLLKSFFKLDGELELRLRRDIEHKFNALRRDVIVKGLRIDSVDEIEQIEDINLLHLEEYELSTVIDLHDIKVGDTVEIRIQDHFYDGQRGTVLDIKKSGYLIEIVSKRPPSLKKTDDTKGKIILRKQDIIKRSKT